MKLRKLFIIGFLVVATLVVSVGFASLSGNLMVNGRATFMGQALTQSSVTQQLKFIDVYTENCIAELVTDPATNSVQNANMIVDFHDTTGSGTNFVATAVFTIEYGGEGSALPGLTLGPITDTSVLVPSEDAVNKGQFTITCDWVTGAQGNWTSAGADSQHLIAGTTKQMRVIVRYNKPQNASVDNISCDATIAIKMPWITDVEGANN